MKANTMSSSSGVSSGRISRRRDVENEEIQMYISKLKDLVPFIPKNRKLSKLEVIQYVIEYICDLQDALEVDMDIQQESDSSTGTRTPLGVLAPNTILPPVSCLTTSSQQPSGGDSEKCSSSSNSNSATTGGATSTAASLLRPARPVSC